MKLAKQISAIALGIIFWILSSGFIMYKSYCTCTGNELVSVFVQNQVCDTNEADSCCEELVKSCCSGDNTLPCISDNSDCNCCKLEKIYYKLKNQAIQKDIKFIKIESNQLLVNCKTLQSDVLENVKTLNVHTQYVERPSTHNSSLEFLILIQQLKISHIA